MPRTPAEKERLEKKQRLERTLIPVVCVIALAVFVILSAVFAKKERSASEGTAAAGTAAPSEAPFAAVMDKLYAEFHGERSDTDDSSTLACKSPIDGEGMSVTVYEKGGRICMRVVRSIPAGTAGAPAPAYTESIFIVDQMDSPSAASAAPAPIPDSSPVAEELVRLLGILAPTSDEGDLLETLKTKLDLLFSGGSKKASVLCGAYVIKLSYSESDSLMTVECEHS